MTDYTKWPHLENLDRVLRDIPDYLTREGTTYTVTEKVHGFNARFGVSEDGVAWAGSRNTTVVEGDETEWQKHRGELQGFVDFAHDVMFGRRGDLDPVISRGETFYGEWAGRGIQKGVDYGDRGFYLFGQSLTIDGEPEWSSPDWVRLEADVHGLAMVPTLSYGGASLDRLTTYRDGVSSLSPSGDSREGIVITPWPAITDQYGHIVIAKYKSPAFEERKSARREQPAPAVLESVQAFVDEYVTAERLEHVLQQVGEALDFDIEYAGAQHADPLDVRYTGDVLRAMYEDIVREGAEHYAQLNDEEKKLVGKYSAKATKPLLDEARQERMAA